MHLHCFQYGRPVAPELEQLCETVTYYRRKTGLLSNLSLLPYTVKSRQSTALENNLLANNYPILFEVLHTCYLLGDVRFSGRKKIYRHSNIEHDYYRALAATEKNTLKRLYLLLEAWRLQRFEKIIAKAQVILAVNKKDAVYFKQQYPGVHTHYLPSFHRHEKVSIVKGRGKYVLFHGNLSISENYEAAMWLLRQVFGKLTCEVIVAGLKPPAFLKEQLAACKQVRLIEDPGEEEMNALVANAQVHVLWTAQPTGLKLKLLNVLFSGRFVVLNNNMLSGTAVKPSSTVLQAETADDYIAAINACFAKEFSQAQVDERLENLTTFDNRVNASALIKLL